MTSIILEDTALASGGHGRTGTPAGVDLRCSVGIMAYNEAENIGRLLEAFLNQRLEHCSIEEIIVVASGCTDNTEEIVTGFCQSDVRVKLISESKRNGKAAAINQFLSRASFPIVVLASGDILPSETAVEKMVSAFKDPQVGMVGGRPVPVNDPKVFMGFCANLMWELHHHIALEHPKLGEMVAFRRIIDEIPKDTAVDEACIESMIIRSGYRLRYIPDAIINNKGPTTVKDFLKQRRRIAAGHHHLKRTRNYHVSTTSGSRIIRLLFARRGWTVKTAIWATAVIGLEIYGRALGAIDFYLRDKNPFVWEIAGSTKRLADKC